MQPIPTLARPHPQRKAASGASPAVDRPAAIDRSGHSAVAAAGADAAAGGTGHGTLLEVELHHGTVHTRHTAQVRGSGGGPGCQSKAPGTRHATAHGDGHGPRWHTAPHY